MFQRIFGWIREVIKRMFGRDTLKSALQVDIAISSEMSTALQLWSAMYANQAPWLSADVKSLNLPAAIAGEIARAVTIELQVEISGSARAAFLQEQFSRVQAQLREQVETLPGDKHSDTAQRIQGRQLAEKPLEVGPDAEVAQLARVDAQPPHAWSF